MERENEKERRRKEGYKSIIGVINPTNATFVRKVIHMSSHWRKTLPVWYTEWKGIRV